MGDGRPSSFLPRRPRRPRSARASSARSVPRNLSPPAST